jgi:uncharacterized OsmC-like protein
MAALQSGEIPEIVAYQPKAVPDFAAWSKSTGNPMVESSVEGGVCRFAFRKKWSGRSVAVDIDGRPRSLSATNLERSAMSASTHNETPRFHVTVTRTGPKMARAEAHGQVLDLAIKGGDPSLGFTAPEALLAAFGACILSIVTRNAAEMGLAIEGAQVVFDAAKRTEPLGIDPLRYRVILTSEEPAAKLQELYEKATTDGTATNALLRGVAPAGGLVVQPLAEHATVIKAAG